jgi:hypothetical protein
VEYEPIYLGSYSLTAIKETFILEDSTQVVLFFPWFILLWWCYIWWRKKWLLQSYLKKRNKKIS